MTTAVLARIGLPNCGILQRSISSELKTDQSRSVLTKAAPATATHPEQLKGKGKSQAYHTVLTGH
jgi:hypothetical protein